MTPPLISICLPNLNTRPFLPERMQTILDQTLCAWELIICDSYSTDGSWEYFEKFKSDRRIRMHQVPREGLYAGWNECLRRATGEYVYIATSDDTMREDCLERLLEPLEKHPELHLALCDFQEIDESSKPIPMQPRPSFIDATLHQRWIRSREAEFLLHACFGTMWKTMTALLFRRKILGITGFFRTDRLSFADEEWTLRATLTSDVAIVPGKLATWRRHGRQITPTSLSREQWRIYFGGLNAVLTDAKAGVPEHWKRIDNWKQKIMRVRQLGYLEWLDLYRWVARRDPVKFMRSFFWAFLDNPRAFWICLSRGFGKGEELRTDHAFEVQQLIREFGAEWPPKRLWG